MFNISFHANNNNTTGKTFQVEKFSSLLNFGPNQHRNSVNIHISPVLNIHEVKNLKVFTKKYYVHVVMTDIWFLDLICQCRLCMSVTFDH